VLFAYAGKRARDQGFAYITQLAQQQHIRRTHQLRRLDVRDAALTLERNGLGSSTKDNLHDAARWPQQL
jgi:hypothetical protein